jgi:hypothetical protein
MQVRVPLTGVVSALHFVGPNSTHNTIEHRAATALAAFPQLRWLHEGALKRSARSSPFFTVKVTKNGLRAVFSARMTSPPIQVRFERLGTV